MRQHHRAGEKLFVDYAGQTVPIVDMATGNVRNAQVFVAVLGASNYTYHVRAFSFLGGVTELVVPDNLKSGVKKACFYDPDINPTYYELAVHYDTAVLPARVRKPRDKAKAEVGVQVVERWILARLRKHTFFSLTELNTEIRKLLDVANSKPFKKITGCRRSLFESIDRPALKPLPVKPYELAEWKKVTVGPDYHVEVDEHYYSVFHQLIRKKIDVRFTSNTVECFYRGKRVASHIRSDQKGYQTTIIEHMPVSHQKYLNWRPESFVRWAEKIGPQTVIFVKEILQSKPHPQLAYRNLLGIKRLGKSYTEKRLEAACHRAVFFGTISFRSIESILKNGLDSKPLPSSALTSAPVQHDNIRGSQYYGTLH
jgi:transposase